MYILYTDNFRGGRAESRRILDIALVEYANTHNLHFNAEVFEAPSGKPHVLGGPEFSVSHSGNYWAVMFDEMPCGLDIQVPKHANYESLAYKHYTKREADLVSVLGEDMFFKLWTRREALIKCVAKSVFTDDVPELLFPPEQDAIKVLYEGKHRVITDLDLPVNLYVSMCKTVSDEWEITREVPKLKRLDF